MRVFFVTLKSKLIEEGPVNVFRPRFPARKPVAGSATVGAAKQAGFNIRANRAVDWPVEASLHNKLGRCTCEPSPIFVPVTTVYAGPLDTREIPPMFQPRPRRLEPSGRS